MRRWIASLAVFFFIAFWMLGLIPLGILDMNNKGDLFFIYFFGPLLSMFGFGLIFTYPGWKN